MSINIAGIWLLDSKPETYCQAYHAGQLYSMVENFLPQEPIPPMAQCASEFPALRELFGERLWQRLCSSSKFRGRVAVYQKLSFHSGLPISMLGTEREFALGYAYNHKRTKLKRVLDDHRKSNIKFIEDYLSAS
jgi:hypothetical protein